MASETREESTLAIKILSHASVLPKKTVTNAMLEKTVNTTDEWITKMTGIKERHVLNHDETFIDCTWKAATKAIQEAAIAPDEIGLIIIGTSTPEQIMPSSATILQGKLGIKNCIAFDLQAACSGFVYGVTVAYQFMQNNKDIRYALIMGCDAVTKVIDWQDRTTCVLFGDGFGGILLQNTNDKTEEGITYCELGSDGLGKEHLEVPWGIAQGQEKLTTVKPFIVMNGREVFKSSVNYFTNIIKNTLEKNNLHFNDLDLIIPHQANVRIIQAVAEKLGIPMEKIGVTLDKHSNTSAASIPLAFDELVRQGKIKRGHKILLVGFGAGYTWGTVIFKF